MRPWTRSSPSRADRAAVQRICNRLRRLGAELLLARVPPAPAPFILTISRPDRSTTCVLQFLISVPFHTQRPLSLGDEVPELRVCERSIQSVAGDADVRQGAEAIQAGRMSRRALAPPGPVLCAGSPRRQHLAHWTHGRHVLLAPARMESATSNVRVARSPSGSSPTTEASSAGIPADELNEIVHRSEAGRSSPTPASSADPIADAA